MSADRILESRFRRLIGVSPQAKITMISFSTVCEIAICSTRAATRDDGKQYRDRGLFVRAQQYSKTDSRRTRNVRSFISVISGLASASVMHAKIGFGLVFSRVCQQA